VEWGSVESPRRRFPAWRFSVPRVGGVALAAVGFALLVAAELRPWVTDQLTGSASRSDGSRAQLSMGLESLGTSALGYHLGALVLLAVVGLVLVSPPDRRRVALGLAVGVAAGELLIVLQAVRVGQHTFANSLTGGQQALLQDPAAAAAAEQVLASGFYLAVLGVLALAGAALVATLTHRAATQPTPDTSPADPVAPDDRELTVTRLEPLDESYFVRE